MRSSAKSDIDLDSILVELGEFGKYQIVNYALMVLIIAVTAGIQLSYIFSAGQVDYRLVYQPKLCATYIHYNHINFSYIEDAKYRSVIISNNSSIIGRYGSTMLCPFKGQSLQSVCDIKWPAISNVLWLHSIVQILLVVMNLYLKAQRLRF